ncbi:MULTISPECIES: methyltransferase domain-containing protein [unclassified Nocardioides]|uniref:methyltransferase domain-containing protein n=1 Tax=unclassified Nocardioides TaxID=2615069 RepID=UPI0006F604B3|nr:MULTISPECIES: methyltransferase domain-containing protein [unclassified Nocardioides]KRA31179.1 hypothetical protein ASD81_17050 [Nocardioides sp. Root614]KRA87799.1 hypothetical protein ASD84_17320 [Nocardioides sp. Root682]
MSASIDTLEAPTEVIDFGGLAISWDSRVLRPRAWTAEQARWAAELAGTASAGPILELCCGAGQIGLLAARLSGRPLVQVDRDPVAAEYASRNAAAAGITSDVRCGPMADVLAPGELFDVVVADPPWLRTAEVDDFPDDPVGAVDGGTDGCDLVRDCIDVALAHLAPGGRVLVQVGDLAEVEQARRHVDRHHPGHAVHAVRDRREEGAGGVLVMVGPREGSSEEETEGQVSEVGNLDDVGEIRPEDAVAAHPDDREVQEGATGPNARTGDQDNHDDEVDQDEEEPYAHPEEAE